MEEKTGYRRLKGIDQFRLRLVLSTLSGTPIQIEEIRPDETSPGLRDYEASLLRLVELISDDCSVVISSIGTKVRYKPGVIVGGKHLGHECGVSRSIGYFLEPLIVLALFGKKPLSITLKGITNDFKDPCVDTFRTTTLHMLKQFGVPLDGVELKVVSRGVPPQGGGEVTLALPIIQNNLSAVSWVDEGMVKRIRGVAFSTKASPQFINRMISSARGILNNLLPDVYIDSDHKTGQYAGRSPGYGMSLVAQTTSGCLISADYVSSYPYVNEMDGFEDPTETETLMSPEEIGVKVASVLLEEIGQGGVVDSTHQGLLFLLCALCPKDVSKVRVGLLTPYAIETLRQIKDFLGVKFDIKPHTPTNTVILRCLGSGLKNLSRKIQ
ncbi:putative RNA 3'-terminal phosphate cyclase-like protein [Acorus calamus]|uniref:RNA 3'-terminal phosphate cyclase-like protein n=1 Tax=Acorus calamus TaxID=4465 RepID=A0AAV9CRT5_ACOCL|nr:putative RNA 3'-terminal phosphate cyclase-like protein [Acorus calamus]